MSFSSLKKNFQLDKIKTLKPMEIGLLIVFIIYIVFPTPIPHFFATFIDSPLGIISLFCITVFLFIYTNPILAVVYIFVAYELLRRSSLSSGRVAVTNAEIMPTQNDETRVIKSVSSISSVREVKTNIQTLEEEIVLVSAPVVDDNSSNIPNSDFQPVADTLIAGASTYSPV